MSENLQAEKRELVIANQTMRELITKLTSKVGIMYTKGTNDRTKARSYAIMLDEPTYHQMLILADKEQPNDS